MSTRCFAREHDRIRSVKNGIGDVGGFRAGRGGTADHRFQHLGGGDNGDSEFVAAVDQLLLHDRNFFRADFHGHVAAGDQQTVGRFHDGFLEFNRFQTLDLGDHDGRIIGDGADLFLEVLDVLNGAHEGKGDGVHAHGKAEGEVFEGFFGQAGNGKGSARKIHSLVIGEFSAHFDFHHYFGG